MALSNQEWQKINQELKKNIEPIIDQVGITLSVPFDMLIQIFQGVLEKVEVQNELDGRDDIERLLLMVYAEGNIRLAGSALDVLSGKLEGYMRKVFKIANQSLLNSGDGMLAEYLKTIFRIFKNNSHPDFLGFEESYIKDFFNRNSPNYNKPEYFLSAHKLGDHFKRFYTCRNEEGHLFKDVGFADIFANLNSILIIYLYITSLFADKLKQKTIHQPSITTTTDWSILSQYCGNFAKRQTYVLVIDKLNYSINELALIGNIKWDFIFDLDESSESNGFFYAIKNSNKFPYVINRIVHTNDDRGKINATFPDNTVFWYYVKGCKSILRSLPPTNKIVDWRIMYGRFTQDLMREYYTKRYSLSLTPIKVIVLSKDVERIKDIIYAIKGMDINLPSIDFVFANENNSELTELCNEISGKMISIPKTALWDGLMGIEGVMNSVTPSTKTFLPCHSSKGNNVEIPESTVASIKQYFQIIHLSILNENQEQITNKTFYQGRRISWKELDNHLDVDRNITRDMIKMIRNLLVKRVDSEIVYLTHYAGTGGSTVARRIAYDIFKDFPVLFLNEMISSYGEIQLTEKLLQLYQLTELPCLVVVDNSNITKQQIEILEKVVANRLAKTVFLLVESTFSDPVQDSKKFYIPAILEKNETDRFITKFSVEYKEKADSFQAIPIDNPNSCNPFFFGLIANEKEYTTIEKYVNKRLEKISEKEKDLLLLLSFCHIFAIGKFREVPHYIISKFLDIDEEYIRLRKHTKNHKIYDLIIETDDLSWRTIHPLIAEQVLNILLGINDLNKLNPFELKKFSIHLIKTLRNISENRNSAVLEFLHNIFILRDVDNINEDFDETDSDMSDNLYNKKLFSKLTNALDNNNNRFEVFEVLTEEFPDENPHFWGHFSRLCSIDRRFDDAIHMIDTALSLEDDFIFHHIKGMCYRTELYRLKDMCWGKKAENEKYGLLIWKYFEKASESFKIAREVAPLKEHGYIAFVQMVIQMIDFEYSVSNYKTPSNDYTDFIIANDRCRNILTQANDVINDYKDNNQEYENSKIVEKQILLLRFFGTKEKMISSWQALLDNNKYDQNLVRRQLIYAYLAKNEFNWNNAKGKDIRRIMELCEGNLENRVEIRDLRLWFDVARHLNMNTHELIKKAQELEYKKQTIESAYMLMCLFAIQALNGVKSGIDSFEKYQKETSRRASNTIYSKIFCREWVGMDTDFSFLLNHRQIGEWSKELSFFKGKPIGLLRLKGKVVKYINRMQGYIEVDNSGIQVMYQPASCNHYSDDAHKQTSVTFFMGFNFDGARAFEVTNE